MKKIWATFFLLLIFTSLNQSVYGINFGYYKSDYEYGIFDSIKFNWRNREKGQKFIELRTETEEGRKYLEQETKRYQNDGLNENERFRMIRENTVPL